MANNDITMIGVKPSHVTSVDVTQKTTSKKWPNGRITARREWAEPKYEFELEYNGISFAQYQLIEQHFLSMGGKFTEFDFTDERTSPSTLYLVRYNQDDLTRKPVKKDVGFMLTIKVKIYGTLK